MSRKPVTNPQTPANEDDEPMGETLAAVKAVADAKKRRAVSARQIGIGAAVGIGSAAIVAGLLYWRGNRK